MLNVGNYQNFQQFVESGKIHERNPEAFLRVKKADVRKGFTPDGTIWNVQDNFMIDLRVLE